MNSIASPQSLELTEETTDDIVELHLELNLPVETEHLIDGNLFYSYTPDQFRVVLKIFKTYTVLADTHDSLLMDVFVLEKDNSLLAETINKCNATLNDVNTDREFIYKLREDDIKEAKKDTFKAKLKTVLIAGGSSLVGVAVGILIGVFAI